MKTDHEDVIDAMMRVCDLGREEIKEMLIAADDRGYRISKAPAPKNEITRTMHDTYPNREGRGWNRCVDAIDTINPKDI